MGKLAVLMTTCYRYRDAWIPFLTLFERYWPDCQYKKHIAADYPFDHLGWKTSCVPPQTSWCKTTLSALKDIDAPNVLLLQEDFFFNRQVHTAKVEHALDVMLECQADMMRLYPCPGPTCDSQHEMIGRFSSAVDYQISCQASIWRKPFLEYLLKQFETPFQFEMEGSKWAKKANLNLMGWKREIEPWPISYICTAIVKGRWTQGGIALCRDEGIDLDLTLRPIGE